jgi:hypothetical protein
LKPKQHEFAEQQRDAREIEHALRRQLDATTERVKRQTERVAERG